MKLLPITINGIEINPTKDGLYSLNEIHKASGSSDKKAPSEWNNNISRSLLASGNFRKVDKKGSFGTEQAAIAYAMWVSLDFYMLVVSVFITVRHSLLAQIEVTRHAQAQRHEAELKGFETKIEKLTAEAQLNSIKANLKQPNLVKQLAKDPTKRITVTTLATHLGVKAKHLNIRWMEKGWLTKVDTMGSFSWKVTPLGLSKGLESHSYGDSSKHYVSSHLASNCINNAAALYEEIQGKINTGLYSK
jgi:hypothetical protein